MQTIQWKTGTANDFFVSQAVIHQPGIFGLRPSWAAGVRQRLTTPKKEFLEKIQSFSGVPLYWLSELPEPGDASTALSIIKDLNPIERIEALTLNPETNAEVRTCLQDIAWRGSFQEGELIFLRHHYHLREAILSPAGLNNLVTTWSELQRSGETYLSALQDYYHVFFEEEEVRIRPALQSGLERAKELASRMELEALIEELSHGIRFAPLDNSTEFVLSPSYWCSPLIYYTRLMPGRMLLLFGARPEYEGIVPGAGPPSLLVSSLKCLADPTRLRILRFLADQPLSSSELARLLRLRLPTVIHHLRLLRLAGLVQITVGETEKRYAARLEILDSIQNALGIFIATGRQHGKRS
jgi:DNA-binding transcriptional ArsR family regulator